MSKSWTETGLTVVVVAVGLLIAFISGLWAYMSVTATPLHPNPNDVPAATHSVPPRQWEEAVMQGRRIVRAALTEQNLPGLSVAVGASGETPGMAGAVAGGEIIWAEGFGWADLTTRAPVTPETRFRIGTASTALTSAAVGLLLQNGQLKLEEPIQRYVPEFPEQQWPMTLGQVMAHVAGVPNDSGDEGPLFTKHCERPVDALPFFGAVRTIDTLPLFSTGRLLFEPGTEFRYSSYGWILVSAAVEAAAQEPFLSFMREQIFTPLGMDHTIADSAIETIPDRATPYFPRFAADPTYGPDPMRPLDYSCYSGSSVFLSTPSDLVRFATAINNGKLLQPATVQLLQTAPRLASGQQTGYGLGWDLETVTLAGKPTRVVGHDGDVLGGMAVSFMTFPEYDIVIAVTSNISYADTNTIAVKIAQAFAR